MSSLLICYFFNAKLNCHVVIELKIGRFNPADSGQLNFYTSCVLRCDIRHQAWLEILVVRLIKIVVVYVYYEVFE